jgi:hypothetical protein
MISYISPVKTGMAVIFPLGRRTLRFRALSTAPGHALGDAGHFGPRAAVRGVFIPRPGPILYCYFGARTSGDNLIGQHVLEIFIYVTFMGFREELLKNGLRFAFFFSEGFDMNEKDWTGDVGGRVE